MREESILFPEKRQVLNRMPRERPNKADSDGTLRKVVSTSDDINHARASDKADREQ